MWHSIQENLKLINSKLSLFDCLSAGTTALFVLAFSFYLHARLLGQKKPVLYQQSGTRSTQILENDSHPFGSKSGRTYTFSWCSGSAQIKPANKIYFKDEAQAQSSGRTLSKLCQK